MARIDTLGNFLTDVAAAIREKKGTTDTIPASLFDTEIASIEGGEDISKYFNTYMGTVSTSSSNSLINWKTNYFLKFPDIVIADNVTSLSNFFRNWPFPKRPKVIFNNNVKNISYFFYDTSSAYSETTELDCSGMNVSNVTDFRCCFYYLNKLTSLDLSSWNVTGSPDVRMMFYGLSSLKKLDIRNFDITTSSSYASQMFSNIPTDCEIIVKDDRMKAFVLERFTTATNVKTVEEYEAQ